MDPIPLQIPPFTSDKILMLSRWIAVNHAEVRRGQPLFELETVSPYGAMYSSSALDVESPASGVLKHECPEGTVVAPNQIVGWLSAKW